MKLITLSSDSSGYSYNEEEGFPPEEMEWRIVQLAEERFPDFQQCFGFDSVGLPTVDLIKAGRIEHIMHFEAE